VSAPSGDATKPELQLRGRGELAGARHGRHAAGRPEVSESLRTALSASRSSSPASVGPGTDPESSGPVEHGLIDDVVELQALVVDLTGPGHLGDREARRRTIERSRLLPAE
jgi:hypothetical protein